MDITREYGARIPTNYQLDDTHTNDKIIVLRDRSQTQAANDLAIKLYQFLVASIALFNSTGANYLAVQQGIRNNIPSLLNAVAQATKVADETGIVLAQKQAVFDHADAQFKQGLSLWLPLLFLLPGGAALLIYVVMKHCKPTCRPISTSGISPDAVLEPHVDVVVALPGGEAVAVALEPVAIQSTSDREAAPATTPHSEGIAVAIATPVAVQRVAGDEAAAPIPEPSAPFAELNGSARGLDDPAPVTTTDSIRALGISVKKIDDPAAAKNEEEADCGMRVGSKM